MANLTPEQCRAGRALLKWKQTKLAKVAKVGEKTIRLFEAGDRATLSDTLDKLSEAMDAAGVEFIDAAGGKGPGARLKKNPQ